MEKWILDEVKSKVEPEFKGEQFHPASERFDFGLKSLASPPDRLAAPGDSEEKPGLWRQQGGRRHQKTTRGGAGGKPKHNKPGSSQSLARWLGRGWGLLIEQLELA